jgi:hypothetical protein
MPNLFGYQVCSYRIHIKDVNVSYHEAEEYLPALSVKLACNGFFLPIILFFWYGYFTYRPLYKGDYVKTTILILVAMIVVMLLLTACAPGAVEFKPKPAGFFWGIWHGWIAPVSIIWHFFNHNVRIYETNNSGIWYDIGFYLAVVGGFGSVAITRNRRCRRP